MNLEIYYQAPISFELEFESQLINVASGSSYQKVSYIPAYNQTYELKIRSTNRNILNNHITIEKIIFDNFWTLPFLCRNHYNDLYITYAKYNNIDIDYTVTDNNCLFFMGELIYTFLHPIYESYENPLH